MKEKIKSLNNDANTVANNLARQLRTDFSTRVLPSLSTRESFYGTESYLYQATVGVGKTSQMVELIGMIIDLDLRTLVRAPTTKLAEDIAHQINLKFPEKAGVWYGREQDDPKKPAQKMCPRFDAINEVLALGGQPELVCGTRNSVYCRYHPKASSDESCGYKAQSLNDKNIVVVAGDAMLSLVPRAGMKRKDHTQDRSDTDDTETNYQNDKPDFDIVILDETDPFSMLEGFAEPKRYTPNEAGDNLEIDDKNDREILVQFSQFVSDLILIEKTGYLSPFEFHETVVANKQDKIDFLDHILETATRYLRPPLEKIEYHKLSGAKIQKENAKKLRTRQLLQKYIDICEAQKTSVVKSQDEIAALKIFEHEGMKQLNIRKRKHVSHAYSELPFIILDATPQPELLKYIYKNLDFRFSEKSDDGKAVKRFQLSDSTFSYKSVKEPRWAARLTLLTELLSYSHGATGLICPKITREFIQDNFVSNTKSNHFGALRGDNSFARMECVVVASRQAQPPRDVEDMVQVLTGEDVARVEEKDKHYEWYQKKDDFLVHRSRAMGWPVQNDYHPDPLVEAARSAITNDNLEQALGRTRNVRRNTKSLFEYILTNVATNRYVDGVFTLTELKTATGWVGILLHAGIWVGSGKGAAILFHIFRGLLAQRWDSLYRYIIGDPAFETPEQAARWRKDQLKDNQAIAELVTEIDEAMDNQADSVSLLHSPFPVAGFRAVKAKVQGSRYFAQLYVRIEGNETPVMALQRIIGDQMEHIKVK
jgi:hypothetical protein